MSVSVYSIWFYCIELFVHHSNSDCYFNLKSKAEPWREPKYEKRKIHPHRHNPTNNYEYSLFVVEFRCTKICSDGFCTKTHHSLLRCIPHIPSALRVKLLSWLVHIISDTKEDTYYNSVCLHGVSVYMWLDTYMATHSYFAFSIMCIIIVLLLHSIFIAYYIYVYIVHGISTTLM